MRIKSGAIERDSGNVMGKQRAKVSANSTAKSKGKQRLKVSTTSTAKFKGKQRPKVSTTSTAQFNGKPLSDGSFKFSSLKAKGWIRVPINLGILSNVRGEDNRYFFEFNGFGNVIEAWISKNNKWANQNLEKLKPGNGYILKGNIVAEGKTNRFNRSSNSTGRYELMLDKIDWLESKIWASDSSHSQSTSLSALKAKIRDEKAFAKDLKNINITSGDVYRYRGCESEDCFAKVVFKNGNYKCRLCDRTYGPNGGKLRICIKDVKIKNEFGNELHGLVCFHQGCEQLFGKETIRRVSNLSDWYVVKAFEKCIGAKLNATLKHKRSTTGSKKFSLVIENIQRTDKNDTSDGDENEFPALPSSVRSDTSDTHCCCESRIDDENDDDSFDISKEIGALKKSLGRVCRCCENVPEGNDLVENRYTLWENEDTKFFGLALVINIKNYDKLPSRDGSEKDVESICRFLSQFKIGLFNDKVYEDLNLLEFMIAIDNFKTELVEKKYSCCFVFAMGHGTLNYISLPTPGEKAHIYKDIIYKFVDQVFNDFAGKPKVFVFQACQNSQPSDCKFKVRGQIVSDMLWCMPCCPGMKAKRNPETGSPFIQTLISILEEFGDKMHLRDVVDMTQKIMRKRLVGKSKDEYNIPQYSAMCFQQFYFKG